jgi:hypothetical protein
MMTSHGEHAIAGDPLPGALAAYWEAADAGRVEDALAQMAPDVLVALPPPGGHEVDPRRLLRGRDAARQWLAGRDHNAVRHRTQLCVTDGSTCMVEGQLLRRSDGRPERTYVLAFRLGPLGIERYLAFTTDPVAMPPRTDDAVPGDARAGIEGYLHDLDAGRFEAAASWFSADAMYCHPPYRHTNITSDRREVFSGREELLAAFRQRGKQTFTHRMLKFIQRGPNGLFELVVENLPDGGTGSSVCSVGLDDSGRIRRYVANYTEPGVPQS